MKPIHIVSSVVVAFCLAFLSIPVHGGEGVCGFLVTQVCPGCSASQPSDGTCFCGDNSGSCDCVKASGGLQSGSIITCETDDFDFIESPAGKVITSGVDMVCKTIYKCRVTGQKATGLSCGVQPNCGGGSCSWQMITETKQGVFIQGDPC